MGFESLDFDNLRGLGVIKKEFEIEQIDLISKFLFTMLFPDLGVLTEIDNFEFAEEVLDLKTELERLVNERKFCEAENLLFREIGQIEEENFSQSNSYRNQNEVLRLAVWFYCKLNGFDDKVLNDNNFSRIELLDGLKAIEKKFTNNFKHW